MKDENSPGRGRYDERYLTLDSIGKGAFGFVKLAKRRSDNREVRARFKPTIFVLDVVCCSPRCLVRIIII